MSTPVTERRPASGPRERWGQVGTDLREALRLRPVRRGLIGTGLIAIGSLTPAYLPQNSPWWVPLRAAHLDTTWVKIAGTFLVIAGIWFLVDGWFRLRPAVYADVKHWAVLAIWSLPFLLAPPIFSHDAYSYAAQGWMVHNQINPYTAGPGILPGAFADQVAWVWRFTPAPYGPLSLQIAHLLVDVAGFQPYTSALLMRVPALVGVALITVLLPRIAHRMKVDAQLTAWFATINPLLVIDFVGGAHNDSLMMGLVVLAIWLSFKGPSWLAGAAVVGVAASIKQPAFLAAYVLPLLGRDPWPWTPRGVTRAVLRIATSCAIAIGTFALISLACGLGFGWTNAVNVPGMVVTVSPATVIGQGAQLLLNALGFTAAADHAVRVARTIGLVISAVLVVLFALTVARTRPIAALSWSYLAVAIGGPALHSWYVLWGALLLPLTKPSQRTQRIAVASTIILLCYSAVNLAWRNGALALGIAALGLFLWQLRVHEQRHARSADAR